MRDKINAAIMVLAAIVMVCVGVVVEAIGFILWVPHVVYNAVKEFIIMRMVKR